MKLNRFQKICGLESNTAHAIFSNKKEVASRLIPEKIFLYKDAVFKTCVKNISGRKDAHSKKLKRHFLHYLAGDACKRTAPKEFIDRMIQKLTNKTSSQSRAQPKKEKKYPLDGAIPLSGLDRAANQLRANGHKKAKKIHENGKLQAKGKGEKKTRHDITINSNRYILSKCPKSKEDAADYVKSVMKKGSVFVSVLEASEVKKWYNNFWKKEKFQDLPLGGWTVRSHEERRLHVGEKKNKDGKTPHLTETTITLQKGDRTKKITHLHYDKWIDQNPAPDLQLFGKMLDRVQELRTNTQEAVAINCKGGVGRTGLTALALHLRSTIDNEKNQGKDLSNHKVDIPALLHQFRLRRPGLIGHPEQFTQIYKTTAHYYKKVTGNS